MSCVMLNFQCHLAWMLRVGESTVHPWMSCHLIVGSVPFPRCSGSFPLAPWFCPHWKKSWTVMNRQPSTSKPSPQQTELPPLLRFSSFPSHKPEARRQYFCISVRASSHTCLVHRLKHENLWHCMFWNAAWPVSSFVCQDHMFIPAFLVQLWCKGHCKSCRNTGWTMNLLNTLSDDFC